MNIYIGLFFLIVGVFASIFCWCYFGLKAHCAKELLKIFIIYFGLLWLTISASDWMGVKSPKEEETWLFLHWQSHSIRFFGMRGIISINTYHQNGKTIMRICCIVLVSTQEKTAVILRLDGEKSPSSPVLGLRISTTYFTRLMPLKNTFQQPF